MKKTSVIYILIVMLSYCVYGQEQDLLGLEKKDSVEIAKKDKNYKNTISINVSNPTLISTRFIYLSYERLVKENQSFSISFGSFSIPKFGEVLSDSLDLDNEYDDTGLHFACDYRFYLKQLNKYNAPRGVYIGPYYTYNYLKRENSWHLHTDNFNADVNSEFKVNIHNIGFQLGYQFVFWDRLSVDCILMGPGFGYYSLKTKLGTDLSPEDESKFFERLNELLDDKFPGYDYVIDPGEFKTSGSVDRTGAGFRYVVNVGFRF